MIDELDELRYNNEEEFGECQETPRTGVLSEYIGIYNEIISEKDPLIRRLRSIVVRMTGDEARLDDNKATTKETEPNCLLAIMNMLNERNSQTNRDLRAVVEKLEPLI